MINRPMGVETQHAKLEDAAVASAGEKPEPGD